jgi:hypothetical protein
VTKKFRLLKLILGALTLGLGLSSQAVGQSVLDPYGLDKVARDALDSTTKPQPDYVGDAEKNTPTVQRSQPAVALQSKEQMLLDLGRQADHERAEWNYFYFKAPRRRFP